jgi:PST family polysaccharide transporter/lipopolysaccharide exporter
MSSLKTIPSVLLERELAFGKLVIPQLLENLVYNITAVFFAWKGLGVRAFTYAVLARGVVGLFSMYLLKPWMPGFAFSKKSLKKLLSFGVPYQANTLLATLKDDGMTAVLGGILGPAGVGLLGWAQKWGQAPLRFFMDHIIKVTFPAFARMQDEKDHLKRSLTRSIFFICFLVFPSVVGLILVAPLLTKIIPRYEKWEPALLPLTIIGINTLFASVTTQLTNLLNSIGKIKITFKLMIMWTVLTWLFVPGLAYLYGVTGAATGYAIVSSSSVIAIYIARKYVKFSLKDSVVWPALSAALMGVIVFLVRSVLPVKLTSVWVLIGVGALTYAVSIYLFVGSSLIVDAKKSFRAFISK